MFENRQRIDRHRGQVGEEALKKCPECGKAALGNLVSAPAFQVKGKFSEVTRKRTGHNLDGGASHSRDAGHSHGAHSHTHGPGCGHKH